MIKSSISNKRLFSLKLTNRKSGSSIVAHFSNPTKKRFYLRDHKKWTERWDCMFSVSVNGKRLRKVALGHDWLGALLSAVEYIRMQIPDENDRDWLDNKGVDSWAVLPKRIPFSWGYPLYRQISDLCSKEESNYVAKIEKRRLTYETKKISKKSVKRP